MNTRVLVRAASALVAAGLVVVATAQPASATAVVTGHTGSGTPALAQVGDRLYVAWTGSTGTAAAKGLNFGWSTAGGKNIVKVANPEKAPQNEGPALLADPDAPATGVFMAWPDARHGNTLTIVYYNGSAFSCRTGFAGLATGHSPALAVDPSGKLYAAWTNTAGHLNAALIIPDTCATNATHTMTMLNRQVFAPTSAYGPGLIFDANLHMTLAYVTSDAAHAVNLASWGGGSTLASFGTVAMDTRAMSNPTTSIVAGSSRLVFLGANGFGYFASIAGCANCSFAGNIGLQIGSGLGSEAAGGHYAFFNSAGKLVVIDDL